MNDSKKQIPRRSFLIKGAWVSTAAFVSPMISSSKGSPDPPAGPTAQTPNSTPKISSKSGSPVNPLRVAIQGSFAIFFGRLNVQVFAPTVGGHFYQVCDGDMQECDIGNKIFDLSKKDYDLTGVTPAATPSTFNKQTGSNNIDPTKSPVYYGNVISRPSNYRLRITLPLPDDISINSHCIVTPDAGDILVSPPFKLQQLTLMHTLIYKNYDPTALAVNDQSLKNIDHLKIVAEPINLGATVQECMDQHIQRANDAVAQMLGLQTIQIDSSYCGAVGFHSLKPEAGSSSHGAVGPRSLKREDGGGAQGASRLPACMSVLINDTGTGGGS